MTGDGPVRKEKHGGSVVSGAAVAALGLLVSGIAAVEYYVSADIVAPGMGPADGGNRLLGMTFGTSAYIAGYAASGVILFALGVWKIYRARRKA